MAEAKISVRLTGRDTDTAYIALPGHRSEPGIVGKTIHLDNLVTDYKGPNVNLDFDVEGRLIGIEILA